MHALAPYFIRCYNPDTEIKNVEERYDFLNKVGQYDTFDLLLEFIDAHKQFEKVDDKKQTYKFLNVQTDKKKRTVSGWMCLGEYGIRNDIIDTDDNKVAFEKHTKHADVKNYFFIFSIPRESRKGIALLHTYKSDGVKSMFYGEFSNFFRDKTKKNLQIQPLTYEKAMEPWLEAEMKEIKVVGFKPTKNIEDKIHGLGDVEHEYKIKAKRNKTLGKFKNFLVKDSDESKLIEVLNHGSKQVKALVSMGGSHKTFTIGHGDKHAFCQIDVDEEEVTIVDGNPDFTSINKWASDILKEISRAINIG